jgi:acyl-CoA reductase-like NAD-dependent aldehyde dehydrogenase/nicotinamidase-related amidase
MKIVLLLVDFQRDYLAIPRLQPPADVLVARAAKLLDYCRSRNIPVIHIWTTINRDNDRRLPHWRKKGLWICVDGTQGHMPPDELMPVNGETVVHKTGFNAFADGSLDSALKRTGCEKIILAGLHLHTCIRTAAMECLERNYDVCIAEEAVASDEPIYSAAVIRWLSQRCVVFKPGIEILAHFDIVKTSSIIHRSPRITEEVLFEVPVAGESEIKSAVETAQHFSTEWHRTNLSDRQHLLQEIAAKLDASKNDFALQMAIDIGKPLSCGLEEVRRAVENIRDTARYIAAHEPLKQETSGIVCYRPLGVVAIISAWNNPVAIPLGKIAPALAYGNTVVWKPAPPATRISEKVLRLLYEAGIPTDAVGLLTGDNTTAMRLAADDNIDAVTLTGSIRSGFALQEICARHIIPLQAELSGNNAAIVWNDADFKYAASQVAWGAFAFAGQRCTANRRVIVHTSTFESFLSELEAAANKLVWDDPLKEETDIGPVISVDKRDEIKAMIHRIQAGGEAHRIVIPHKTRAGQPWVGAGTYICPAIVCCDHPDHTIVQEETMGPLLVVQRADDFEHAMALCNGVRHGLVSALFSASPYLQHQFMEKARTGILKFNVSTAGADVTLPFGGWKASGIGPPEHSEGDRCFYTRTQTIYGENNGQAFL